MKSPSDRYPGNTGITLLELILVMFIIGVAASITGVSIAREYEKAVFKGEVKAVRAMLKYARDHALLERAVFTVDIGPEGESIHLRKNPPGQSKSHTKSHTFLKGITAEGKPVVFFSKGNSSGGRIEVSGPGERRYVIEVDKITGSAKIKRV